jgi:hypothetical protein
MYYITLNNILLLKYHTLRFEVNITLPILSLYNISLELNEHLKYHTQCVSAGIISQIHCKFTNKEIGVRS